jgi:hypothetical protein
MIIKSLCFLCAFFAGYVSCAIGGEVIPDQDIVKINGISVYHGEAKKFLQEVSFRDTEASIANIDTDITIKNSDLMDEVEKLYNVCTSSVDREKEQDRDGEICIESSRALGVRVLLHVDKDKKLITKLVVHR